MAKKQGYKISYKTEEQKEVTKLIVIILVVTAFVVGAYFLTRAVVTKDLGKKTDTEEQVTEGVINYNVAIVGEILNRSEKKYYVAVFKGTGEYGSEMATAITGYESQKGHLRVYRVDLDNKFNADFYDPEHVKLNVTDPSDFKFGDVTLLKVEGGKVTTAITDLSKIKKELK